MSYYRVLLHGTGILVPSDGGKPIVGFYVARAVQAQCAEEAVLKAKSLVMELWQSGEYRELNKTGQLLLSTEEITEVSYWQARKDRGSGHAFYDEQ